MVKQKRKEKAGKWDVPLPKGEQETSVEELNNNFFFILVRAQGDSEVFKMMTSGKRKKKAWKRMVILNIYILGN